MKPQTLALCLSILMLTPACLVAQEQEPGTVAAVTRLDATPEQSVFDDATRVKPLELGSAEAAQAYFTGDALKALNKAVDWERQTVLVFAWRGSGQDKLSTQVKEQGDGIAVHFVYSPGRTRDLRPHTYVYAVRNGVSWETK
ncbi:MAG: hypothetical protein ACE37H_01230 [Phycisphaeraceae bacterium]